MTPPKVGKVGPFGFQKKSQMDGTIRFGDIDEFIFERNPRGGFP